ncbi:MAG: cofactor-independent phosphoglycerate mutase [Syntrophobacteraceae bacterium]|nr:cofactor-independent phosphoglycerate mutase [Desulfobacteraceae bacterium]
MKRKYIILVGDGMGDYPQEELNGKTPLEAASTPNIDRLAPKGRMGMVKTVPKGMEPGSDVANMSLLGYDPAKYHTGRSPLEAASMGVRLAPEDVAFRCNLVTLGDDGTGGVRMIDYSAGHVSTEEARELIAALQEATVGTPLKIYPGVSYRHLLVWPGGRDDLATTPPHDISGQPVAAYGRVYSEAPVLSAFIEKASVILPAHPVNQVRTSKGKTPANAVWLWGQGKAPAMPTLAQRTGLNGAVISAVDLLKGIGIYAGMNPVAVPGATGYLDTNYAGKVDAALRELETGDLVFVHIEAPDEAGHEGDLAKKIEAIEAFDARVVGPMVEGARKFHDVSLLIVTDHLTPISKKTHVGDPVPFLIVEDLNGSASSSQAAAGYSERSGLAGGWMLESGAELFSRFVGGDSNRA